MYTQRQSCDRCRQQKIRCRRDWGSQTGGANAGRLAPCERCAKANAPCVYSVRQKVRRSSHQSDSNSNGNLHFSDDLNTVLSVGGISDTELSDLSLPMLNGMSDFDVSSFHSANSNTSNANAAIMSLDTSMTRHGHMTNGGCDHEDTSSLLQQNGDRRGSGSGSGEGDGDGMIDQLIAVSTRATRATGALERLGSGQTSLTVNSYAVNEAFEAANSLVRIINSIPAVSPTAPVSMLSTPPEDGEPPPTPDLGLIFMAFASHQHVLALFKAICDTIQKSVGYKDLGHDDGHDHHDHDRAMFCGDEASSAQFVMVLQLVIHMLNRMGRSLRIRNKSSVMMNDQHHMHHADPHELTFGFTRGKENQGWQGIVDTAQDMLRTLPDEHIKLKQVVEGLQTCIEDRLHM